MPDLNTRLSLQKRFQGKQFSAVVKKGAGVLAGQKLNNQETKKILVNTLSYKSKGAREQIMKKMGLDYKNRGKFEQETFGGQAKTPSEMRAEKAKKLKRIKYNIAMSVKVADADYEKLIGQRVGSDGKTRRSFYDAHKKENQHMLMSGQANSKPSLSNNGSSSNLSFKSTTSLSKNENANKMTGGFGVGKSTISGTGFGGITRVL